jgi:metal-sulfur cluster biosynthetic enzyme
MNDSDRNPDAVNPHTGLPVPPDSDSAAPAAPADQTRAVAPAASASAPAANAAGSPESSAPSQQEMAIRAALETVMDPEINLSVIDLGLIREVELRPNLTYIKMMLTTPFCPYAPQLVADVKQASMSVVPQECEVELLPDAWSPQMMPDPGLLGFSY